MTNDLPKAKHYHLAEDHKSQKKQPTLEGSKIG